ncbi:MAG: hypothetical protein M1831_007230 [Alyxoria varia]|nr:MAG: hypothetical protein M1831_007230 [Alyxoria varia]
MAGSEVVASVIGLAGVGIKLAKTLYQAGHNAVPPEHNINRIATNVSLFSSMLKHVSATLEDIHSLYTSDAVQTIQQITEESSSVFNEITQMVISATSKPDKAESDSEPVGANDRKRRVSTLQRAKWYFDQPAAERLLAQLDYLKTTLSVLLQTLNLAATLQNVRGSNSSNSHQEQLIEQETTHVENLLVAQHLAVMVLDEYRKKDVSEERQYSSISESEGTDENKHPKMLKAKTSSPTSSVVRLGESNMEFFSRKTLDESNQLTRTQSASRLFIDDLLNRWTRLSQQQQAPSSLQISTNFKDSLNDSDTKDIYLESQGSPASSRSSSNTNTPTSSKFIDNSSEDSVNLRPSHSQPKDGVSRVQTASPAPRDLLHPNEDPHSRMVRNSSQEPNGHLSRVLTPPPPQRASTPQANQKSQLSRIASNPEADGELQLQTFHDHHGLRGQGRQTNLTPGTQTVQRSPASLAPSGSHMSSLAYYTPRPAVQPVPGSTIPYPSKYQHPYVESVVSNSSSEGEEEEEEEEEDDSDDDSLGSPLPQRSPRVYSKGPQSHAASATAGSRRTGNGLGIPWRIRISSNKYFDFRDDKLVGPRTPWLPTEPMSWMYSHDNACTEISKSWVCEPAIREKQYPFNEIRDDAEIAMGLGPPEDGVWKVLNPLKFNEIEALVERSIDIVRARTAGNNNQNGRMPAQPHHWSRGSVNMPAQPSVPQRVPPNYVRSQSFDPTALAANHPPGAYPGSHLTQQARGPGPGDRSPNETGAQFFEHYPGAPPHQPYPWQQQQVSGHQQPPPYLQPNQRNSAESARDPHRHDRGGSRRHREKDHHDRDRPVSRGKQKEKEKKKKSGSGAMAGTLGGIAGLAALLEGLDGAF